MCRGVEISCAPQKSANRQSIHDCNRAILPFNLQAAAICLAEIALSSSLCFKTVPFRPSKGQAATLFAKPVCSAAAFHGQLLYNFESDQVYDFG
jgi:hypothetical protein